MKTNTIKNEIGHIMKRHNVLEYKSPEDNLTIDDFYKTIGYACLYKGYGESVNKIPTNELTVSLFREAYPRELFSSLKQEGNIFEEKYPGIYYVTNNLPFPVQVVVTNQLNKETHSSLRILSHHADKDDIEEQLNQARETTKSEVTLENIQNIMDSLKLTAEQAMDALKIAPEQREIFMAEL